MIGLNKIGLNQVQLNRLRLNAPFPAYGKMAGGGGSGDGFPQLPGDVTRWHFGGLTNEMMAAMDDPRIEDADHKGRFLSFKNFAWKEGSGISDIYPGFILGDGVDDFAVTEEQLNFEDTYTVYTAFIPFQNDPVSNMRLCGKDSSKDFYMNYTDLYTVSFFSIKGVGTHLSKGFNLICCKRTTNKLLIKNLITGQQDSISSDALIHNPGLYYLWRDVVGIVYAKAAIAGQIIDNGHFATDEEDVKVLAWYKKEYPWLFFDQAWTVAGKSNEDADRDTIANITGNGNNLVLSNFGFAENSGYGLYATNFSGSAWSKNTGLTDVTPSYFVLTPSINLTQATLYTNIRGKNADIPSIKINIDGLGDINYYYYYMNSNKVRVGLKLTNGINILPVSYIANLDADGWVGFGTIAGVTENITIEQIPEYEGYLVTDGVDDIASSNTVVYEADFTFIGEWKFIQKDGTVAGINSASHLYIQNRYNRGATVMINSTSENKKNITDYMTFKAITSKGKGYDENWNEVDLLYGDGNKGTSGVNIGGQGGTEFCHMIFKNMALYMNKVFTKDECIKAYNYLQILKAK